MGLFGNKKVVVEEIDLTLPMEILRSRDMERYGTYEERVKRRCDMGRVIKTANLAEGGFTVVYDLWAEKKLREEKEREAQGLTR